MRKVIQHVGLPARRHFLGLAAAVAGSLPLISITSAAKAGRGDGGTGGEGEGEGHHCFLRGTRIRTPGGEIAIEDLNPGDLVETLNGTLPIKWIGRRTYKKAQMASWHRRVAPIRVARFSLDDQYPLRDLYLSPEHSFFIDKVLIPVKYLVNDKSIAPDAMDDREVLSYFHIELDAHEVVFAEGAPVETLQVTTGREAFANFVEYERLYGHDERPPMKPFAPVLCYQGGRAELQALARLALSRIVDVRDPVQRAYDRIAARAELACP
jgi:hypothetical protein